MITKSQWNHTLVASLGNQTTKGERKMTELKQYPNIRKVDAFELDNTIYICYVDRCNPNNIVWMKVDRADPEKDLETYNLLEKLRIEVKNDC